MSVTLEWSFFLFVKKNQTNSLFHTNDFIKLMQTLTKLFLLFISDALMTNKIITILDTYNQNKLVTVSYSSVSYMLNKKRLWLFLFQML